jgi:hypothetical protein
MFRVKNIVNAHEGRPETPEITPTVAYEDKNVAMIIDTSLKETPPRTLR